MSWENRLLKVIPDESCCSTTVCREGLGSGRRPTYITEDDWQEVEEHLMAASDFCAFHRRALFVERLLSTVVKMNWDDHWAGTVQAAAKKLVRLNKSNNISNININIKSKSSLNASSVQNSSDEEESACDSISDSGSDDSVTVERVIQPEDAHLVLLGLPLRDLLHRLRREILPLSRKRYDNCCANLRMTEANLRLGLSSTKRKKKCQPRIGELEKYWKEWLHPDTIFPSISFRGSSSSSSSSTGSS